METINTDNYKSSETHYVTTVDIKNMDPCSFQNRKNPLTNANCRETFQNIDETQNMNISLPEDPITQLYFAGLGGIAIYIIYKFMEKSK
jgi:hypothetical protein